LSNSIHPVISGNLEYPDILGYSGRQELPSHLKLFECFGLTG